MNINLNGTTYTMTTTFMDDNILYMYLKGLDGRMYKKSVSDIILYLYQVKGLKLLSTVDDIDVFKKTLLQVDQFLSDLPEYQYIKQVSTNINFDKQTLTQIYQDLVTKFAQKQNSIRQTNTVEKVNEQVVNNVNNGQSEELSKKEMEYRTKSNEELVFLLQMYPNGADNDYIRNELEKRSTNGYKEQVRINQYHQANDQVKVKQLEQRNSYIKGYVSNYFNAFVAGIAIGSWILVLIKFILK